jgi:trimethylamine--corrinoid protein Co-methyltransferase
MRDLDAAARPMGPIDRLDAAAVQAVHDASMSVLEEIGVKLNHDRARALLADHGADVDAEGTVTIPRDLVEERVEMAPDRFVLHGRNAAHDVTVGGDAAPVRSPGYGPANVQTLDGRRRCRLADYEALLKLAHLEDVITCAGYGVCEPTDLQPATAPYTLLRRALELTDKPVMGPTYGAERAEACMDMVGIAVGDRALDRPYVAGLINTTPPRRIDEAMLGGLLTYAEHGQPLVVSSFTMAGASGPPTLAASLAQTNAENLVGITLAQLVTPGAPVVYGAPTATVDGRYGSLSIGGPESAYFAAFAGQMARYYGLPSRSGGGLTDAKAVDYQSGFESTFLQAATRFAGVDFVLHAAGILESYATISLEKFVLDCEAIRYLDCFGAGFDIEPADFRLDDLAAVDPGGYFRNDGSAADDQSRFYRSGVVDKRGYAAWADAGGPSTLEAGAERVDTLLDRYEEPSLPAAAAADLEAYVERNRPTPS